MWSRRAQEYEAKISSGKIYELAEVVRDLNKGDDLMVDQSYSERQLFEKAYERILSEFQIVMGVSLEDTQKKLDKALKRNLESQQAQVKAVPAPTKLVEPETSEPEPEPTTIFAENIKVETSDWGWGATAQGHVMEIMDVTIEKKDGDWYLCMTKDGAPAMPDIKLNDIGQIASDQRIGTGKKKNVDFVIQHGTGLKRVIRPDERPDVRGAKQDRVNLRKFINAFQQAGFGSLVEECFRVSRIVPSSGGGKRRKTKRRKSTSRTIRKRKSTTKRRTKKRRTKKKRKSRKRTKSKR